MQQDADGVQPEFLRTHHAEHQNGKLNLQCEHRSALHAVHHAGKRADGVDLRDSLKDDLVLRVRILRGKRLCSHVIERDGHHERREHREAQHHDALEPAEADAERNGVFAAHAVLQHRSIYEEACGLLQNAGRKTAVHGVKPRVAEQERGNGGAARAEHSGIDELLQHHAEHKVGCRADPRRAELCALLLFPNDKGKDGQRKRKQQLCCKRDDDTDRYGIGHSGISFLRNGFLINENAEPPEGKKILRRC